MENAIEKATNVLREGGIVIFPTDTAFGIGCRIDDERAVKRLFAIRRRPETWATPVLISHAHMAKKYVLPIPQRVEKILIERYWPGALTIVLPCKTEQVPELVRGGGKTLGIRMPNHPVTLDIIKNLGIPILGPSANIHGEKTPYMYEDLDPDLVSLVDFVLPGACIMKKASTVIDCSVEPWNILREGAVEINVA